MKNFKLSYLIIILYISIILVLGTLFIPTYVDNSSQLLAVQYGYPLHFVSQNIGTFEPPVFPYKASFISPWEYPAQFNIINFIASIIIVFIVFYIFLCAYFLITNLFRNKKV